ncbi:MAG: ECF-type riboflavin transporter substrate-binding protein [Sporolactobacillus sp.]
MKKELLSVRTIVAVGIGAALFILLRYIQIPTFVPNTSIDLNYVLLALFAVLFGPIAGGLIGIIGHALGDALQYGSIWWSWAIVSGLVGVGFGLLFNKLKVREGIFDAKSIAIFNIVQIITQAIGWFLIAPSFDILIYGEPANKVYLQGIVAGVSDIITVGILGTLLIWIYAKTQIKKGSLKKEA